jgi:hypothetical protein
MLELMLKQFGSIFFKVLTAMEMLCKMVKEIHWLILGQNPSLPPKNIT